jgi:hypothetical protein
MSDTTPTTDFMLKQRSVKELAALMARHPSYVRACKRRGFKMIGGRATFCALLLFLEKNPHPWGKI